MPTLTPEGGTVKGLVDRCFENNKNIKSVIIPGYNNIAQRAFHNCTSLETVEMQDGTTCVGWNCFEGCTSLRSVKFANTISYMFEDLFSGCTNLKELVYPISMFIKPDGRNWTQGWAYEYRSALYGSSVDTVIIPEGATTIFNNSFSYATSLKHIYIPSTVGNVDPEGSKAKAAFTGIWNNITIHGKAGSYIESYAKENGISFISFGETPNPTINPLPTEEPEVTPTPTVGLLPTEVPEATPTSTVGLLPTPEPEATPTPTVGLLPTPEPESTPNPTVNPLPTGTPGHNPDEDTSSVGIPVIDDGVIVASNGSLTIEWSKADNAAGYSVWRSTSSDADYVLIGEISDPDICEWQDINLVHGVEYFYKVQAFSSNGSVSAFSATVSATAINTDNPSGGQTIDIEGSFNQSNYSVEIGGKALQLTGNVSSKGSAISRITINVKEIEDTAYTQLMTCTFDGDQTSINLEKYEAFEPDTTSYPFNEPGTYTLQLWASTVDGTSATKPLATTTLHVIKFSAKFDNPTKTLILGDSWIVEGKVSVDGSELGRITVNAEGLENSSMMDNFADHNCSEVYLRNWAAYTIDTTKEPFNKPGTYTLHVWAKDVNGVGGSRALAEMTVEVVEGSENAPEDYERISDGYKASDFYRKLKQVSLTGDYIDDIIAVAVSQIEYKEGSLSGTGGNSNNCTEYGNCYNDNGVSWCAYFVSWCAERAKIPSTIINPHGAATPKKLCLNATEIAYFYTTTDIENKVTNARIDANEEAKKKAEKEGKKYIPVFTQDKIDEVPDSQNFLLEAEYHGKYYANRKDFIPQPGDLIFFHNSDWTYPWGHVGIVTGRNGESVYFIDGNNNGNGEPDKNRYGVVDERNVVYTTGGTNIIAFARPNYGNGQ